MVAVMLYPAPRALQCLVLCPVREFWAAAKVVVQVKCSTFSHLCGGARQVWGGIRQMGGCTSTAGWVCLHLCSTHLIPLRLALPFCMDGPSVVLP